MHSKDELSDKKYSKMWVFHNPDFNKEAGLKGCQKLNSNTANKIPRKEEAGIQHVKDIYRVGPANTFNEKSQSFYSTSLQQGAHYLEQQRIRFNLEMAKQSDILHHLREKSLQTQERLHQMIITSTRQSFISSEEERIRHMYRSCDYHSPIIMQKAFAHINVTNTNGILGGSTLQELYKRSSAFPTKFNDYYYCQDYGIHSK